MVQFIKTQVSNEIQAKVWKRCQLDCSDKKKIPIHTNSLSVPFHRPRHSLFFGRDHLRSNIGITCGPGSFAVRDHLRFGIICGPGIICGLVHGFSKEPNPLNERLNEQNSCFRDVSFTERGKEIALRSLSSRQNIK